MNIAFTQSMTLGNQKLFVRSKGFLKMRMDNRTYRRDNWEQGGLIDRPCQLMER